MGNLIWAGIGILFGLWAIMALIDKIKEWTSGEASFTEDAAKFGRQIKASAEKKAREAKK